MLLKIRTVSKKALLKEYKECEKLWGKYSCDSLGYYMTALHKRIVELGGWPTK